MQAVKHWPSSGGQNVLRGINRFVCLAQMAGALGTGGTVPHVAGGVSHGGAAQRSVSSSVSSCGPGLHSAIHESS